MDEMTAILPHFSRTGQFIGFWGSSGPAQSTMFVFGAGYSVVTALLLEDMLRRCPVSRSGSFSGSELTGEQFSFTGASFSVLDVAGC